MGRKVRTNVVIDEALVRKVMDRYGLRSKREAIDFALRSAAGESDPWKAALALEGSGWGWEEHPGEVDRMRDRPIQEP